LNIGDWGALGVGVIAGGGDPPVLPGGVATVFGSDGPPPQPAMAMHKQNVAVNPMRPRMH
jgi:hypothetical protein